jgi:thioredoxin-related protein
MHRFLSSPVNKMIFRQPSQLLFFLLALAFSMIGCSKTSTESKAVLDSKIAPGNAASTNDSDQHAAFYVVGHYDEAGDPVADLKATITRAKAEQKRILLQVGGDWCAWCARISNYMETNEKVRDLLEKNFVVMKVTYPGDHAESFLKAYPEIDAYPHFFVLDGDGTFLHSQGTGELEKEASYDQDVFVNFLSAWIP